MALVVRSAPVVVDDTDAHARAVPPVKDDGTLHMYSIFYDEGTLVGYADTPTDLLIAIMGEEYSTLDEASRLTERIAAAIRLAPRLQGQLIAANREAYEALGAAEREVLFHDRTGVVEEETWSAEVPLVLVDVFYDPHTEHKPPLSNQGDVEWPDNVVWLRVSTEWLFLESLSRAGLVQVHQRTL